jgi:hypothetical protein
METQFTEDNLYILNGVNDTIFLCENLKGIGKLVLFSKIKNRYVRTSVSYFLNTYIEGDFKSILLNIENYELIGSINKNFTISDDRKTIKELR